MRNNVLRMRAYTLTSVLTARKPLGLTSARGKRLQYWMILRIASLAQVTYFGQTAL